MTKLENALVWLYVKTWGKFGDHVMGKKDLWNFGADDLETAIMGIAYPRKKEKTERVKALTDLIMEKFDYDGMAFREWSAKIHDEVIESLLEHAELDSIDNQWLDPVVRPMVRPVAISQQQQPAVIKILKWDPGKHLRIFKALSTNKARFMIVNLSFLASTFAASVTDGIFKAKGRKGYGYARDTEIMSTQSANGFEWSIKLMRDHFNVGIASLFKREEKWIYDYDPTAISYHPVYYYGLRRSH